MQLRIILGRDIPVNKAKQFAGFSCTPGADPVDLKHFSGLLRFALLGKEQGHRGTDQERHKATSGMSGFQNIWFERNNLKACFRDRFSAMGKSSGFVKHCGLVIRV